MFDSEEALRLDLMRLEAKFDKAGQETLAGVKVLVEEALKEAVKEAVAAAVSGASEPGSATRGSDPSSPGDGASGRLALRSDSEEGLTLSQFLMIWEHFFCHPLAMLFVAWGAYGDKAAAERFVFFALGGVFPSWGSWLSLCCLAGLA